MSVGKACNRVFEEKYCHYTREWGYGDEIFKGGVLKEVVGMDVVEGKGVDREAPTVAYS